MKTITERWLESKLRYVDALSEALKTVSEVNKAYTTKTGGQKLPPIYVSGSPWHIDYRFPFNVAVPDGQWHYHGSLKSLQKEIEFYDSVTPEQCMVWIQRWEDSR